MSAHPRRVVVTQRLFDPATVAWLESQGCEVELVAPADGSGDIELGEAELIRALSGAAGWIVGLARVTRPVLEALPDLKVVARRGVGYERVDVQAARALGKVATIAAGGNHDSVADHALAMMLALGRRLRETQARMLGGDWSVPVGSDLFGKTVGVVGAGRIGRAVVRRLSGFDATVLVHARTPDRAWGEAAGVTFVDMAELLARSDVVTLHAPLTPETRFLIGEAALAAMKPGAILVNTARGGLVDDRALLAALERGRLGGAGLDTFVSEADPDWKPVTEALLARPDVVATPHAAASSREGLERTNRVTAECVVAVLDGRDPPQGCVVADGRA